MSIGSISYVDFKKWPCCRVGLRVNGPIYSDTSREPHGPKPAEMGVKVLGILNFLSFEMVHKITLINKDALFYVAKDQTIHKAPLDSIIMQKKLLLSNNIRS